MGAAAALELAWAWEAACVRAGKKFAQGKPQKSLAESVCQVECLGFRSALLILPLRGPCRCNSSVCRLDQIKDCHARLVQCQIYTAL